MQKHNCSLYCDGGFLWWSGTEPTVAPRYARGHLTQISAFVFTQHSPLFLCVLISPFSMDTSHVGWGPYFSMTSS